MHHLTYTADTSQGFPLCFLVPVIRKDEILKEYIEPFGIPPEEVLVLGLHYSQDKKKTPAAEIKDYITTELIPTFTEMGVEYIVVADSDYFKALTKATKVDVNVGYVMDCTLGPWKVAYVPNFRSIFYDPEKIRAKISQAMTAVVGHASDTYQKPGNNIVTFEEYPKTTAEISAWLEQLLLMDCDLSIDIEAFSLKHHKAGIGTITFCWNKHEGIAFPVDYQEIHSVLDAREKIFRGRKTGGAGAILLDALRDTHGHRFAGSTELGDMSRPLGLLARRQVLGINPGKFNGL